MRRTTIFLDEKLQRDLQRLAARRGVPFAQVVREALAAYMVAPSAVALPDIAGRYASGMSDTSEQVDELLWRSPRR